VAASGPSGSVEQRVTEPVEVVTSVERSEVLMHSSSGRLRGR
jgi:hypothetical protein